MKRPDIPLDATPKQVLQVCGGWYECPKRQDGTRLGPLVGYAGTYEDNGVQHQYVGDHYADYAMIEQWPSIALRYVIAPLMEKCDRRSLNFGITTFCGAPEGGKSIAQTLAEVTGHRYPYPEKVEDAETKTAVGDRKATKLAFGRHRIYQGERVALVEDVCNNFSTTLKLIKEIEARGATVACIICFLNRSERWRKDFTAEGRSWPVIALWDEPMPQYRQHAQAVREDMQKNNFAAKPKLIIDQLRTIMIHAHD